MASLAGELFFLIIGALAGAYLQTRREKVKRIREEVCDKMSDEVRSAAFDGNIDQGERWTMWTELNDLVKRELPEGLREEFARYFQLSADLNEQKDNLSYRNQKLGAAFADSIPIIEWEDDDLRVATAEYDLPTEDGTEIRYDADFEEWMLEYKPILSDAFENEDSLTPAIMENAIRSHDPDNYQFQNLCEVWDSIVDSSWSELIYLLYLAAEKNRYSLYVQLLENNKGNVKESAQEIDEWFTIVANTDMHFPYLHFPYWLTIKKWSAEIRESD